MEDIHTSHQPKIPSRMSTIAKAFTFLSFLFSLAAAENYSVAILSDSNSPTSKSPYSSERFHLLPKLTGFLNNGPRKFKAVFHVGDFKGGDIKMCNDSYFEAIKTHYFDSIDAPVVYTPGDNDWSDCHRLEDGNYHPLERLQKLRSIFFPMTGLTLGGRPIYVESQGSFPPHNEYRENMMLFYEGVVFATLHTVGSNNDRTPWYDLPGGDDVDARVREYNARDEADISWLQQVFAKATQTAASGIILVTQAGMWPAWEIANGEAINGFDRIAQTMAQLACKFDKPVWLINGDQHDFVILKPFTPNATHPGTGDYGTPNMNIYRIHGEEYDAPKFTAFTLETYQKYDEGKPWYSPDLLFDVFELKIRPELGDDIFAYQRHRVRNDL